MADHSNIEWTDASWNPVTGCSHVSEGCRFCYAETMAKRLHAMGQTGYTDLPWTAQNAEHNVMCHEDRLDIPLKWKKPRKIFVNSMSDLFHERVPFEFIKQVFNRMCRANHHTYQVLTKRADRMLEFWQWFENEGYAESFMPSIPKHIWMLVSVENQKAADERIPKLVQVPAAVRGLSCEPLLGPVDLVEMRLDREGAPAKAGAMEWYDPLGNIHDKEDGIVGFTFDPGINWVIVGGESGPHARPMNPGWARSLRDQCVAADVPFFFKQHGEWFPRDQWEHNPELILPDDDVAYINGPRTFVFEEPGDVTAMHKVGKHAAGRLLDGVEWNEFPQTAVPA